MRSRNNALSFVIFLGLIAGIVFYVNWRVAPGLPPELLSPPTPTPNIFTTPLAPPTPLNGAEANETLPESPAVAPTVTLPGESSPDIEPQDNTIETELATDEPQVISTPFISCEPSLRITEPLDGSVAFSQIEFFGTANTGELHLFVIELNGPQTSGDWTPISTEPKAQPVEESSLGTAELSQWTDGPYLVRLRSLDRLGNEIGRCVIQLTLDNR